MEELLDKIESKKAKIGVIGPGCVGLPLALEFVRSGYCVTGIDKNKVRIRYPQRFEKYSQETHRATLT